MVSIEPGCFLIWAVLLLMLPLNWLAAAFAAACVHELCHIVAVLLLEGRIQHIRIGPFGAQIRSQLPGRWPSPAASLAGPAGSLCLLLFCRCAPRVAVCGCVQGLFNLIPIYPLDGGRLLYGVMENLCPDRAAKYCHRVELAAAGLLLLAGAAAGIKYSMGIWPVLTAMVPISNLIRRKIPCKPRGIGVQ